MTTSKLITGAPGLEPKTLVESAYRCLRRDIIEGHLAPGENSRV